MAKEGHECASKKRVEVFQSELDAKGANDNDLKQINARLDAQLKIEDFMVKWREANHAWLKLWGPLFISVVLALAGLQGFISHKLEERKANAEIVRNAVRADPEDTLANLDALRRAGLLDMSPEEIKKLGKLTPATTK